MEQDRFILMCLCFNFFWNPEVLNVLIKEISNIDKIVLVNLRYSHHQSEENLGENCPCCQNHCRNWKPRGCLCHIFKASWNTCCSQICPFHWSNSHCWPFHSWYIHQSDPESFQRATSVGCYWYCQWSSGMNIASCFSICAELSDMFLYMKMWVSWSIIAFVNLECQSGGSITMAVWLWMGFHTLTRNELILNQRKPSLQTVNLPEINLVRISNR